ncbi:hypothetical protein BC332_08401 [Capsicum chinense]|nr:hypothetical protein BC332_08401 [Capsicum chinense]
MLLFSGFKGPDDKHATIGAMVELQYEILIAKLKRPARCTDLSLIRKIFIGNDSSKASPSILSLQSQVVRDTLLLKNTAYSQNLCITSVTANTAGVVGIRANGFTTPRPRGRSEIYHMAPTLVAPHAVLITGLLYLSWSGSMIDILALNRTRQKPNLLSHEISCPSPGAGVASGRSSFIISSNFRALVGSSF